MESCFDVQSKSYRRRPRRLLIRQLILAALKRAMAASAFSFETRFNTGTTGDRHKSRASSIDTLQTSTIILIAASFLDLSPSPEMTTPKPFGSSLPPFRPPRVRERRDTGFFLAGAPAALLTRGTLSR